MDSLIFIDTNILLDFYRYPQGSAVPGVLKLIDDNHDLLVTGNQVEMEFKKNRQKVILSSIAQMKGPKWDAFKIPVILSEGQAASIIDKNRQEITKQSKKLKKRIESVLKNPTQHDSVYQTVQRLFRNQSNLNLTREDKIRFTIRKLARKRFILGYPPRKDSDTSIGDAINWEWLVYCANIENKNMIIVSRDSDYGHVYEGEAFINDWLEQEFKARVSRKKKVILTNKLMRAFELASVAVNQSDISAEDELMDEISAHSRERRRKMQSLLDKYTDMAEQEVAELLTDLNIKGDRYSQDL